MDATWGIAMLVVGLTSSIVATVGEGILSTVLFAVRFLLLGAWCYSIVPADGRMDKPREPPKGTGLLDA